MKKTTAFLVFCLLTVNLFYQNKVHGEEFAKEPTQLLILAAEVKQAYDTAQQLAIDMKNELMAILDGSFIKPDDILRVYDIYNKLNNSEIDIISRIDELMNLYPGREELFENMGLSINDLKAFKEYFSEQYIIWTDKVDNTLEDSYGMSLSVFDKMKKARQEKEMEKYFKSIQSDCSEDKGTNCLLDLSIEQNNYLAELYEDHITTTASFGKAWTIYHQKIEKYNQIAQERWDRATNVKGWDEGELPNTEEIKAHWRD